MAQRSKASPTRARDPDGEPQAIEATLNYIVDDGSKIFTETGAPGANDRRSGGKPDPRRVTLRNGRHLDFTLERDGFHFIRHDTKVTDFFDEAEVRRIYYPEMEALVKAESGAARVVVFDHTLRTADDAAREARKIREVVSRVHNDYTEWSGPQRVRDLLPEEADDLLRRRFAIIQVWRPIRYPVETFPLAICNARTLSPANLVVSERRYPNRIGQTYAITYSPGPRVVLVPAHAARRGAGVQDLRVARTTAARAGPPTRRSTTRPRRPMRGRARASKFARSHFSEACDRSCKIPSPSSEPVIYAEPSDVLGQAVAVNDGRMRKLHWIAIDAGETCCAQVDVKIFGLDAPTRRKGPFGPSAHSPSSDRSAARRRIRRIRGRKENGVGETHVCNRPAASCEEQPLTAGDSSPDPDRRQPITAERFGESIDGSYCVP